MESEKRKRLGRIFIKRGIINSQELDEILEEQGKTDQFIGDILVNRGIANEEQIAKTLSEELGFAYVDLSEIIIEPKVESLVPEEAAARLRAVPLFIIQDMLTIAMANPLDTKAVDELKAITKKRIKPVFACPKAISSVINKQYRETDKEIQDEKSQSKLAMPASEPAAEHGPETKQVDSLKQAASLAPIVEMVNNIIAKAVMIDASDIHLEPQKKKFIQRLRVDGILSSVSELPLESESEIISRIKIMADMDIAEKRLPQDGRVRTKVAGRNIDLRVSTFPTIHGENLVMRILDYSHGILNLKQLGFSKDALEPFLDIIKRPFGLILVTGPTGSGKTTTLYAALSEINSLEKNIITLEDPVEYEIPNVRQSQINVKAGLTFASGLRSILRQDPNIIMIGEIRDKETADIAIRAALTGHLVFSTLHTNDAPSAVTRLIDMGVEPFLVASSLIGILSQRLVRVLCPHCGKVYKPRGDLLRDIGLDESSEKYIFYKEAGCAKCNQTGYSGREGIFELLTPNDKIKALISKKASDTEIRKEAQNQGMKTLRESGLEKVIAGVTSVAELLRITETT